MDDALLFFYNSFSDIIKYNIILISSYSRDPKFDTRSAGRILLLESSIDAVSYTHLDVYKRQMCMCITVLSL